MTKLHSPLAVAAVLAAGLSAGGARAAAVRTAVSYRPAPVTHAEVAVPMSAAATLGSVPVGTVVRAVPADCTSVLVANVAYQRCGSTWYQPSYSGSTVTYTVVNPPSQ